MQLETLIPKKETVSLQNIKFNNIYTLKVFDPRVVEFLNELSRRVLQEKSINRIPAVVSLGFWLRKSNVSSIIKENLYLKNNDGININPLGMVFHVCPSNVDTMFLYSLAISLLSGNKNILRISKKLDFDFIHQLFQIINEVLVMPEYDILSGYITAVSYGHENEINTFFSMNADARIIWGGDSTIELFKNITSRPRVKDFYFADRQSLSILNLAAFHVLDEKGKLDFANKFFNDTYTFDQKGCSSPQFIFLYKNYSDILISEFYERLTDQVKINYETDYSSLSSLKLNYQVADALDLSIRGVKNKNNFVTFVQIKDEIELPHSCGGGYFYIVKVDSLKEIEKWISKKIQTVATFGLDEKDYVELTEISYGKGIDRIVPVGKSLDFGYIWDGYNLLSELTTKQLILKNGK